jgi:hypothetical protein
MFLCHYETITVSTYQSLTHRPRLSCTRFSEFSRMQCAVALRSATTGHRTSVCMHPSFEANATDARVSTRQVGLAPCRVSQGKECLCARKVDLPGHRPFAAEVRRRAWQRSVDLSPAVADTPVVAANPTNPPVTQLPLPPPLLSPRHPPRMLGQRLRSTQLRPT